jgi:hypothetical protein
MYSLVKQLENGEFVPVASCDDLPQALQLAQPTPTGQVNMSCGSAF